MANPTGRPRLLLVEDDPDNLEVFTLILGEKYMVSGYTSAAEALSAIDAVRPDIVMLDIGMHPVDGIECLKTIRAMPGYRDVPAVAFTGFARDVERERFLTTGFQAVAAKPILDHGLLMAVIDGLLMSSQARTIRRRPEHHLDGHVAGAPSTPRGSGKTDRRESA
jgi:CheY-like chemotaxis protein